MSNLTTMEHSEADAQLQKWLRTLIERAPHSSSTTKTSTSIRLRKGTTISALAKRLKSNTKCTIHCTSKTSTRIAQIWFCYKRLSNQQSNTLVTWIWKLIRATSAEKDSKHRRAITIKQNQRTVSLVINGIHMVASKTHSTVQPSQATRKRKRKCGANSTSTSKTHAGRLESKTTKTLLELKAWWQTSIKGLTSHKCRNKQRFF